MKSKGNETQSRNENYYQDTDENDEQDNADDDDDNQSNVDVIIVIGQQHTISADNSQLTKMSFYLYEELNTAADLTTEQSHH